MRSLEELIIREVFEDVTGQSSAGLSLDAVSSISATHPVQTARAYVEAAESASHPFRTYVLEPSPLPLPAARAL